MKQMRMTQYELFGSEISPVPVGRSRGTGDDDGGWRKIDRSKVMRAYTIDEMRLNI